MIDYICYGRNGTIPYRSDPVHQMPASSYVTMQYFPQKMNIDNPQKVEINNSDVGLWGSKNIEIKGNVQDKRRG